MEADRMRPVGSVPSARFFMPRGPLVGVRPIPIYGGMCGRYALMTPVEEIGRLFGFPERPNLAARYNIAPTQQIAIVRRASGRDGRELALARWGLVPAWADDPAIGARMINARAESVAEKPSFRKAFRMRRCLIPADGFFEWRSVPGRRRKQPYYIHRRDGRPMAFAGLWEVWDHAGSGVATTDRPLETATVVTTQANALLRPLHHRMPAILDPADFSAWLDPRASIEELPGLLRSYPDDLLDLHPVGDAVGNVRNDTEACILPLPEPQERQPRLF